MTFDWTPDYNDIITEHYFPTHIGELWGNFLASSTSLEPTDGGGLVVNLGDGNAYIKGWKCTSDSHTHTCTNNATKYLYLRNNVSGNDASFSIVEYDSEQGDLSDKIYIAYVVTSGGDITTLTDKRTQFKPSQRDTHIGDIPASKVGFLGSDDERITWVVSPGYMVDWNFTPDVAKRETVLVDGGIGDRTTSWCGCNLHHPRDLKFLGRQFRLKKMTIWFYHYATGAPNNIKIIRIENLDTGGSNLIHNDTSWHDIPGGTGFKTFEYDLNELIENTGQTWIEVYFDLYGSNWIRVRAFIFEGYWESV